MIEEEYGKLLLTYRSIWLISNTKRLPRIFSKFYSIDEVRSLFFHIIISFLLLDKGLVSLQAVATKVNRGRLGIVSGNYDHKTSLKEW